MSERDNGGPAFPAKAPIQVERFSHIEMTADGGKEHFRTVTEIADFPGMTLRDWFAGQALPQAVEDYGQPDMMKSTGQRRDRGNPVLPYATAGTMTREQIIALQAYRYADAMLAARK